MIIEKEILKLNNSIDLATKDNKYYGFKFDNISIIIKDEYYTIEIVYANWLNKNNIFEIEYYKICSIYNNNAFDILDVICDSIELNEQPLVYSKKYNLQQDINYYKYKK